MSREEHLFLEPGVSLVRRFEKPTSFVRATTDTAFKIMMSDNRIATALINEIFRDMKVVDIATPIQIISKGETRIPLQGKRSNAILDYHAIIDNRDHVIIEMQIIRHNNFDKRALFYAASTFANQEFEGGSEWHSQIKNVYAIQFVDYSTLRDSSFRKYYRMTDKFSEQEIEGICLIQIELEGIKEIAAKIQRGEALTAAEWWYYMIENSEKLTENEIQKYQNIGMPEEITEALDKLKFSGWNRDDQQVYEGEIQEVAAYDEELKRQKEEGLQEGLQEGIQKGLQWGQINGLIERFLDHESLQKSLGRIEQNSISRDLVEQVWRDFVQNQPVPDGENLEDFVQTLQNAGILQ
ncbi:MAG: Rpn family recombination-promoting nuclease/putative transposase [Puniceicoccales bacterium]|nr:Rpn family recombination-promoting nuclease/putative transposase [Puniceicoccales bacterium]